MKYEQSAGGVVFTKQDGVLVVLVERPTNHTTWVFPKGRMDDHGHEEAKEHTALREVEEESGVKGKILHPLTPITYGYEWKGEKREKTVYMYIMDYVSGDITKHDWEMEEIIWLPVSEARERLTHNHSKKLLDEAVQWIETHGGIA